MTDSASPLHIHGGNIDEAARRYGIPPHDWLDLSTGINPRPYPLSAGFIDDTDWTRLPGADALNDLKNAAATCYGAPADGIVAAPGSQSLIGLLARTTAPTRIAVITPTYSEHAKGWQTAGHDVIAVPAIDDVPADVTHIVLCNPNNPDGRIHAPDRLIAEAARLAERGGSVIVDEAFADATPDVSVAAQAHMPGLIVLRSFGKFFGLAGVRLGFALTDAAHAQRLDAALGPWAVTGPALKIGTAALRDTNWIYETRHWLDDQADRLDATLTNARLNLVGGTPLFRLIEPADGRAHDLADRLAQAGILVRTFADHPNWIRFGLPGHEKNWARLIKTVC